MIIGIAGKKGSGKDVVANIICYLHLREKLEYRNIDLWREFIFGFDYTQSDYSQYKVVRFADKLKDIVCMLIGCTREQLEDRDFKETPLGEEWDMIKVTYTEEVTTNRTDWSSHTDLMQKVLLCTKKELFEKEVYFNKYGVAYKSEVVKMTPRKLLQLLGTECGRQIIHPNIWVNATMVDYSKGDENPPLLMVGTGSESFVDLRNWESNWIIPDVRFPNEVEAIKQRGGIVIRVEREGLDSSDIHESETALDDYKGFDAVIHNNSTIEELVEKIRNTKVIPKCH